MEFVLDKLVRENIKQMKPYSSARHIFSGEARILLDANENPFSGMVFPSRQANQWEERLNRYPDPLQKKLKQRIGLIRKVPVENIFVGNGSDEAIDLLFRIFCTPGQDNIIIHPPTYGMYGVCAAMSDIEVKEAPLTPDFQLSSTGIVHAINQHTKLIFICSPNNPTGNSFPVSDLEFLLWNFNGIVVVDEAYIDFSRNTSFLHQLNKYPNLVVLQTLSKSRGLAGLRLGMAFASAGIIAFMNKVKYPYNINTISQELALEALESNISVDKFIQTTLAQRKWLELELLQFPFVQKVYPSVANFLLVKFIDADRIYEFLSGKGIIVRNCTRHLHCENCLRITVGSINENRELVDVLKLFKE